MNSWSIENESDTTSSSYVEIEKLKDILLQQQEQQEEDDEIYDEDDQDIDIDELDDEEVYEDDEEDIYEEDEEEDEELDYEEDEESKSNEEEDNILISPATLATPESTSLSPLLVSSENEEEDVILNDSKREVAKLPNIDEPAYLEYEWVFYYDDSTLKGQTSDDYQSYIKNLGSFNTVQGFWGYWNNIINSSMFPDGANLRLFKQGIAPMWEDPCNENGGKWTLSCYKEQSHSIALKTILALIGEQLDHSYDICGFVLSVRSSRHVISVWNKSGDVKEIHDKTSEQLKECVMGKVFKYYPHKQLGSSSGSVPQSPMTPSVSSNSLSSLYNSNNNNYSTTPMKREYSSPMISSNNHHNNNNSRLTQSTSISNDLYKETNSNNNNCNNSNNNNNNNLISSFENVNNNRKETFKHKKSQSASSIYSGGSGNVSTCGNNNNSNNGGGGSNTPLKSSGKILRKENSKSNITLSSIEISSSKDHINKVDENNIIIEQQAAQQQEILYKSNSREDIKLKKQQQAQQYQLPPQSPQQQKKTYKDKSTSSATPSKPPLKDRTTIVNSNSTSPIINVMATVVIPKQQQDEAVNIITAATTSTLIVEPVTLLAASASASSSSASSVVEQPIEPKDEYNESRELLRSNLLSSEEKIIDSSPNDEGTDPFTNDELMENISEISDFHTDESSLSNNRKSKSKKKSKSKSNGGSSTGSINNSNINSSSKSSSHKSNSSSSNSKPSSNLRKNTLKGNSKHHHHHQKGLNSSLLSLDETNQLGLIQKSTSIFNSPTLNFCKEHFVVFFMIFTIISLTVILQKQ